MKGILIFSSTAILVLTTICGAFDDSSYLFIEGPRELAPCAFRGKLVPHGDRVKPDDCSSCLCSNSTMQCDIQTCSPLFCPNPLHFNGECCDLCPYYVPIWAIHIQNLGNVQENVVNDLKIDLNLKINEFGQTVEGEGLWRVGVFGCNNDKGLCDRIGYVEQVLTQAQAAQQLVRPAVWGNFEFTIPGIQYKLDATQASCTQTSHLCVEFAKGKNPQLVGPHPERAFTVVGVKSASDNTESPDRLRSCTPFKKCES